MNTNLKNLTIKNFREGLTEKKFSAFEITEEYFKYIEKKDPETNAYLLLLKEPALKQASEADVKAAKGEKLAPLTGIPLAIKDNILIENEITTSASKILENYKASYDATVIKKLKNEDALFLGKTNMDEFAMGSSTENSAFKKTKNPHDLSRVPGGSSGGSAAAVAADMAVAALGSDTGGSIRQPASFCGVVGLKPTYGAVSRYGLMAMASSLDQIGPITKTVEDAEILFNAIKGFDSMDATSAQLQTTGYKQKKPEELVVGLPKEYFIEGLDNQTSKAINEAIESLKKSGIKFKEISLPYTKYALSCYYIIMPAEVSANLTRFDGIRYARIASRGSQTESLKEIYFRQRGEGFGPEVKRRIILGTFVLSSGYYDAYYAKAQKVRKLIKEDFDKAFDSSENGVDVILTPVSPTPAFHFNEKTDDPLKMYLSDIFTIPVNLAGLPAISIPTRPMESPPVGFQLIGKHFRENDILEIGKLYERINNITQ
ncbi:MAG: Asp-tRNA(Asn)/Glu-tRNA(Gln) amidotransferase subunit GatA [Candidatus Wolfebacteria bacterium]|nr:Asp-tRNA(Asn)/Glu-tRNA(Gln) amidotransferase subunit GatA [Candidatus Wolfebacteria bacterium]